MKSFRYLGYPHVTPVILIFIMISCSPAKVESERELLEYISSNEKLTQSVYHNNLQVTVSFKPNDLVVAQEMRAVKHPGKKDIANAAVKYNGHYYFILSLSVSGDELLTPSGLGLSQYTNLVEMLSFRAPEFIKISTNRENEIDLEDYVLERSYGLASSTDILFVFAKEKIKSEDTIRINIHDLGLGTGGDSFQFEVKELESTPKLYEL